MEIRKIQLVGNRSYAVSLPKEWVVKNSLKQGENVSIKEDSFGNLILSGVQRETLVGEEIVVDFDVVDDFLENFIEYCYVRNVSLVRINSLEFDFVAIKRIKKIVKKLEGYDMISEDSKCVEISFLFKDIGITLNKILFRMVYILNMMIQAAQSKDLQALNELEESEDRLYLLAKRILFSCVFNSNLKLENSIFSQNVVFLYLEVFKKLENIGDRIKSLVELEFDEENLILVKKILDYIEESLKNKEKASKLLSDLEQMNFSFVNKHNSFIFKGIKKHTKDILENFCAIYIEGKFFYRKSKG